MSKTPRTDALCEESAGLVSDDFSGMFNEAIKVCEDLETKLADAVALLREVRSDGVMDDWADDLPARIDALLKTEA